MPPDVMLDGNKALSVRGTPEEDLVETVDRGVSRDLAGFDVDDCIIQQQVAMVMEGESYCFVDRVPDGFHVDRSKATRDPNGKCIFALVALKGLFQRKAAGVAWCARGAGSRCAHT
jgi:hypothetical protein